MNSNNQGTSEISRDLNGARSAFEERNAEASKLYHSLAESTAGTAGEESGHQIGVTVERNHIKTDTFIIGSLVPSTMLSCAKCFLNSSIDIVPAAVGRFLISGAIGVSCIVSLTYYVQSERYKKHYNRERDREEWELENYKEGEVREMVELYESKGMTPSDAMSVIRKISKYRDFFIDVMMVEELEMKRPTEFGMIDCLQYSFVPSLMGGLIVSLPFSLQFMLPSVYEKYNFIPNDFTTLEYATYIVTFILLFCAEKYKSTIDSNKDLKSKIGIIMLGVICIIVPQLVWNMVNVV